MRQLSDSLFVHTDTCNVYVLKSGHRAVLIDFGDGSVLDHLGGIGVTEVTDVLMTDHHRDQAQGLPRLFDPLGTGTATRLHVPETLQELFQHVDRVWLARDVFDNYLGATDRFSLLEPVAVDDVLRDYDTLDLNGFRIEVVPTPGHTLGASSLAVEVDGRRVMFTGDLLYGDGRLWSLATTQYGYNDAMGAVGTLFSLRDVRDHNPDVLWPAHGPAIENPAAAMDRLEGLLWELLHLRGQDGGIREMMDEPIRELTPHLLWHWAAQAHNYFLVSKTGKALMIDAGYNAPLVAPNYQRHYRRAIDHAWRHLRPLGIKTVEVVLLTHYHDDHVCAIPNYKRRHGSEVWAAENFADLLRRPERYDVPCLWFDSLPVDRELPLGEWIAWEEYKFRLLPIPGHTLYAVMIEFEVDGKRVLATGDQQSTALVLDNYVYKNRFRHFDYVDSATNYLEIQPDLIISGHWPPHWVEKDFLEKNLDLGKQLQRLHEDLLPLDEIDLGAEHAAAFIRPYQVEAEPGEAITIEVEARNPLPERATIILEFVGPEGWTAEPARIEREAEPGAWFTVTMRVTPAKETVRRARIAVDMTAGDRRLGQVTEALVNVGVPIGGL